MWLEVVPLIFLEDCIVYFALTKIAHTVWSFASSGKLSQFIHVQGMAVTAPVIIITVASIINTCRTCGGSG
jgi:hypothetical protein